jgi:hypothetical protein
MRLEDFIPIELYKELDAVVEECRAEYFYFNPNDLLHKMFAMQILLAREIVRLREEKEDKDYPTTHY